MLTSYKLQHTDVESQCDVAYANALCFALGELLVINRFSFTSFTRLAATVDDVNLFRACLSLLPAEALNRRIVKVWACRGPEWRRYCAIGCGSSFDPLHYGVAVTGLATLTRIYGSNIKTITGRTSRRLDFHTRGTTVGPADGLQRRRRDRHRRVCLCEKALWPWLNDDSSCWTGFGGGGAALYIKERTTPWILMKIDGRCWSDISRYRMLKKL